MRVIIQGCGNDTLLTLDSPFCLKDRKKGDETTESAGLFHCTTLSSSDCAHFGAPCGSVFLDLDIVREEEKKIESTSSRLAKIVNVIIRSSLQGMKAQLLRSSSKLHEKYFVQRATTIKSYIKITL